METYTQKINREDEVKCKISNIIQAYNRTHPQNSYTVSFSDGVRFCGGSNSHWFGNVDEAYVFALSYLRA